MSEENPNIGKVLRIPIEIVTGDESKVDEAIGKLGKAQKGGLASTGGDSMEEEMELSKALGKSKIGDLVNMSREQIANVTSFAKSPDGMVLRIFMKKFAKGAGAILLATIIMEAIKFGIDTLTKDGMPLDRRFKRLINAEVAAFFDRMMKAQLRGGFRTLISTSIGGLRGGDGNIGGNIYSIMNGSINSKIPQNFYGRTVTKQEATGFNPNTGVASSHKSGGYNN
tara:strand:- start:4403 stop:5077 length:675 start_codon:yes stop_codon:yes gene_type:complete